MTLSWLRPVFSLLLPEQKFNRPPFPWSFGGQRPCSLWAGGQARFPINTPRQYARSAPSPPPPPPPASWGGTIWTGDFKCREVHKNWILPKEMNANRFFWDSHWLDSGSNHLFPSMGPNGGIVAMNSGEWCEQRENSKTEEREEKGK
jgi:hypothetical protein